MTEELVVEECAAEAPRADIPEFEEEENRGAILEAIIFAHGEPVSLERLCDVLSCDSDLIMSELEILSDRYRSGDYGIELVVVAGKYQFRTKSAYGQYLRLLKEERPRKLSPAALETLSVIAYRQPVTRHEIEKIRGVDPNPTLKTLLDRELVTLVGHKETVGQPGLYGTTEKFLHLFGLNSIAELPALRELKQIEGDPGESDPAGSEERSASDDFCDHGDAAEQGDDGTGSVEEELDASAKVSV